MAQKRKRSDELSTLSSLSALQAALVHLKAADARLTPIIDEFGPPERLLTKSSCFTSLAKSILYQQLAGSAAAAIYARFLAACGVPTEELLTPAAVLSAELSVLRGCGLSARKAEYLHELATHFSDGRLSDDLLTRLGQSELQQALTAVRGIGPWTVDMFCIFHRGLPDVLPTGDLGVRKGLAQLCGLPHLPSPAEMEQLTAAWRPYRSVGCYFMWRIPLAPAPKKKAQRRRQPSNNSPLGSAVPAVADVGVNPTRPMLAAGDAAAGFPVPAATMGPAAVPALIGADEQWRGSSSGSNGSSGAPVSDVVARGSAEVAVNSGDGLQLPVTPPKLMVQLTDSKSTSSTAAAELKGPPAAAGRTAAAAAAAAAGVMTRRRLRLAGTPSQPFRTRTVDL